MTKKRSKPKTIPSWRQVVAIDHLQWLESILERGDQPSPDQLASGILASRKLPPLLKQHLADILMGKSVRRAGRKPTSQARLEFLAISIDRHYQRLYPRVKKAYQARQMNHAARAKSSGRSDNNASPSEQTYRRILKVMKRQFPNHTWRALRNLHSLWRQDKLLKAPEIF